MSQRFQFTIEVAANPAPVAALTQATNAQSQAGQRLAAATASATQALQQQEQVARRLSQIHLPEPTMVVEQRQRETQAQAHQARLAQIEQERQARLRMGQEWMRQGRGRGGSGAGAAASQEGQALPEARGQAALQAAYFLDDLQYGLRGVMNNIPQMLLAMGPQFAALAGPIGLALGGGAMAKAIYDAVFSGATNGAAAAVTQMQQRFAALQPALEASLMAATEQWSRDFEARLNAAQQAAEAKLAAADQSLAGLERGSQLGDARNAARGKAYDAATTAERAMLDAGADARSQAQTAAVMDQRQQNEAERRRMEADDKAVLEARQRRQIQEQAVIHAREVLAKAEAVQGPFGQNALGARREIIDGLRQQGVVSDQEQQVNALEQMLQRREQLAALAAKNETKAGSLMNPLVRRTLMVTSAGGLALSPQYQAFRRAEGYRSQLDALNPQIESLRGVDEINRARIAAGDVSFDLAAKEEGAGSQARRAAAQQGQAELDAQRSREEQARTQAEQAQAALDKAQRELAAAKEAEQQAQEARVASELQAQAARVARGELPTAGPEAMGGMMALMRERGGLGDVPMLPGGGVPDLSGAEQGFSAAMEGTGAAVQSTLERMVRAAEAMQQRLDGALNGLSGRLQALESSVSSLSTR